MASRHLARSIAMQSLYEWDFNGKDETKLESIVEKNIKEFGPGLEEIDFIKRLISETLKNITQIDKIIEKAAPEWPINQIAIVDRNILRLGLYELLFGNHEEVPPKVAINESIEIAKNFGGETSGKFVNGVLGTVYREIGEPGKDYPTRAELAKKREEESSAAEVSKDKEEKKKENKEDGEEAKKSEKKKRVKKTKDG